MSIENNLYPPIIDTYMPAFTGDVCKVYFSLSSYNSLNDIRHAQVTINDQTTNASIVSKNRNPSGIIFSNIWIDNSVIGDKKYYVNISTQDIKGGFQKNKYYKVQIRFTSKQAPILTNNTNLMTWLSENQRFFSEWSTVCLIRKISRPFIHLNGFEEANPEQGIILNSEIVDFSGYFYFADAAETEYVKNYSIKIYEESNNKLIHESDVIYTDPYKTNEINYSLKVKLEDGIKYRVLIFFNTVSGYSDYNYYSFTIVQNSIEPIYAEINAETDMELGRNIITVTSNAIEPFFGNLTIRRSSSKTNFSIWEDVHETSLYPKGNLEYRWYDYTIESGVWYKYAIQKKNSKGFRGLTVIAKEPIMCVFDDMFLNRAGMQLRIRYNPSISSMKTTVIESRTDTLGGRFPTIRRNGNTEYKQFPISGLITYFCDEEGEFINKDNIYGENKILYDAYNQKENIDEYQDFIYERAFRERIIDFLQADNVKLFRSTAEGNILIRLMDISFTPEEVLGRMIYSFVATAYEIDECSLDNFKTYGICEIDKYNNSTKETLFSEIGQYRGDTFRPFSDDMTTDELYQKKELQLWDLMDYLAIKYHNKSTDKYTYRVKYLKWIKINLDSEPLLLDAKTALKVEPEKINQKPYINYPKNVVLGYPITINNTSIAIGKQGVYELSDCEVIQCNLNGATGTIDYEVVVSRAETQEDSNYDRLYFYTKAGQLRDSFNMYEDVVLTLKDKYHIQEGIVQEQKFLSLDELSIEAEPGTLVYIKDSQDDKFYLHEIGDTGFIKLYDEDAIITGFYFGGRRVYESQNKDGIIRDGDFRWILYSDNSVQNLENIKNPVPNGVYQTKDSFWHIYYHDQWFDFDPLENIIKCPSEALVDYIYEYTIGERDYV